MRVPTHAFATLLAGLLVSAAAVAQNATTAGATSAPAPTMQHLSLEWAISGDANQNGVVSVRFRAQGAPAWRIGMPLRRVPAGSNQGFNWANRHSGSLFGLQPATTYDIELTLVDPDGGNAQQTLAASTRAVPAPHVGGALRPATPVTLASVLAQAQPGDIVELGTGTYPAFTLDRDGSAGLPLTLRGLPGAVIDGELGLFFRQHVILQNLTVNGRIRYNGSSDLAILGCTINARQTIGIGDGIVGYLRSERVYIAGNTVNGVTPWAEAAFGVNGDNFGEGILVTGPGHVITGNRVRGFRDGISFMEDSEAVDQYSIDVLDNHISESADDGIEADFCFHNCRIVGNRLTNSFIAMSSQPGLGGPTYFVRNQAYNVVHVPFKLYRGSSGDVILHNTVVKTGDGFNAYPGVPIRRAWARNNLFLGGEPGSYAGFSSGSGRVVDLQDLNTQDSSLDYNGYGTTRSDFRGRIGAVSFDSLAQLRALTSEQHAQQVSMTVFATPPAFPQDPLVQRMHPELALRASSSAVDSGVPIANINDGYAGAAPDLGALEAAGEGVFASGFEG